MSRGLEGGSQEGSVMFNSVQPYSQGSTLQPIPGFSPRLLLSPIPNAYITRGLVDVIHRYVVDAGQPLFPRE